MDALKEDILNEVQSKLDGTFVPCCTTVAVEYFNADGVPVRVSLSKTSSHHLTPIDQTARVLRKFLEVASCLPHFYCPFSVFVWSICSCFQTATPSLANEHGKYFFYVLRIDFVVICYYT